MKLTANIQVAYPEQGSSLRLVIDTTDDVMVPCAWLCFSIATPLVEGGVVGGRVVERQGDWHKVLLDAPFDGANPCQLDIALVGVIRKATDYPAGLYVESAEQRYSVYLPSPVKRNSVTQQALSITEPAFIPACHCELLAGQLSFPSVIQFDSSGWGQAWLLRLLTRLKADIPFVEEGRGWALQGEHCPELGDAFELDINETGALLRYRHPDGFLQGQAFLFQYLLQWRLVNQLPPCRLSGSAAYEYRGVHLDVVRHFFSAETIVQWFDIFALYHYNHFHWHLTDDDGWRVESKAYPQLTDIGAWRGPGLPLPPQMGTGKDVYGGYYTVSEVAEVVRRADEVGLTVVPEMDLPGHARALLKSLPQLIELDDRSIYRSVQFHNDNVINPVYVDTMAVIETLIDEWCELFPGSLFHVGSDEIPKGVWQGSPSAQQWVKEQQSAIPQLQGYFLSRVENRLRANGKTMAGWEEVVHGGGTSTATWVYSWQGIGAGVNAAKAGHPVVMTPAQFCYLDLAVNDRFETPGYWWAGTVNVEKAYQYKPKQGFTEQEASLIRGVQYCLWSELVETPAHAEQMWFPRLLTGAEVVFETNTNEGYFDFLKRLDAHSILLNRLGMVVDTER